MRDIIKIEDKNGTQVVSARELYKFLEVNERFSRWFDRMCSYGFDRSFDYTPYQNVHPLNNQELQDYALTLDTAKEISMLQRNAKGKEARHYFIEVEKKARKALESMDQIDIAMMSLQRMRENSKQIQEVKQDIKELRAHIDTGPDYFTIKGYSSLMGKQIHLAKANELGRKASKMCRAQGIDIVKIPNTIYGEINTYPKSILESVFSNQYN